MPTFDFLLWIPICSLFLISQWYHRTLVSYHFKLRSTEKMTTFCRQNRSWQHQQFVLRDCILNFDTVNVWLLWHLLNIKNGWTAVLIRNKKLQIKEPPAVQLFLTFRGCHNDQTCSSSKLRMQYCRFNVEQLPFCASVWNIENKTLLEKVVVS